MPQYTKDLFANQSGSHELPNKTVASSQTPPRRRNPRPNDLGSAEPKGYIYVGRGDNDTLHKIGRTKDTPVKRLRGHQTANPTMRNVLELPCENSKGVEAGLHKLFAHKRRGKEWFALNDEDLAAIPAHVIRLDSFDVPNQEEAEILKEAKSNGILLKQTDENRALLQRVHVARAAVMQAEYIFECVLSEMLVLIGKHDGIEDLITWLSAEVKRFDQKLFREENPDLFKQYVRSKVRRRLNYLGIYGSDDGNDNGDE